MINSSKSPSYFCCNTNCTNCNYEVNKKCVKQFSKKICRKDNYKNGYERLGQHAFNVYNIQYGYYPAELKCFCFLCGKDCNMKTYQNCNCSSKCAKVSNAIRKQLSKNRSYIKVLNPYQDINYSTNDGWPPTVASPTGAQNNTYQQNINDIISRLERRLYKYNGKIYGYRQRLDYTYMCNGDKKTRKMMVACIPGAIRIS